MKIRACIDRYPPPELLPRAAYLAAMENPANAGGAVHVLDHFEQKVPAEHLALITGKMWKTGREIKVRFLDGSPALQARVLTTAKEWEQFANIAFRLATEAESADVRITFQQQGSWSMIGTDCLALPQNQATMCFGWLAPSTNQTEVRRVVVHEFGHALGAIHEHQNPAGGIVWNKPAVYAYYEGPPNNWSQAEVDSNLFQLYSADQTQFTATDPTSIMCYPVPKQFALNGFSAGMNTDLSAQDKAFIGQTYPRDNPPPPPPPPPEGFINWSALVEIVKRMNDGAASLSDWATTNRPAA